MFLAVHITRGKSCNTHAEFVVEACYWVGLAHSSSIQHPAYITDTISCQKLGSMLGISAHNSPTRIHRHHNQDASQLLATSNITELGGMLVRASQVAKSFTSLNKQPYPHD